MKKNSLTKYFSNQLNSFRKNFSIAFNTHNKKEIHRLRLDIKRLRAILLLVEIASDGNFNKTEHFLLFENIFKQAGKVRETQMNLSLLNKQNSQHLHKYKKYLSGNLQKTSHALKKEMKMFNFKKLDRLNHTLMKHAKTIPDNIVIEKGLAYLNQTHRQIDKLADQLTKGKKLHKIRIHLKAMLEIIIVLRKVDPSLHLKKLQKEIGSLNEIIGEWHDFVILLHNLKFLKKRKLPEKEIQDLNELIAQIENKVLSTLDQIEDLFKNYLKDQAKPYLTGDVSKIAQML